MIEQSTVGARASHLDKLRGAIEHAAHLLPAQGPITAFVHHNTLHAFEDLSFEEAVVKGGNTLSCHPYLPESSYREQLAHGRFGREDIEAVLIEQLGDRGDELLGFLGTRFHLRMGMLEHPLRTGSDTELRWFIAESEALRRFRVEVSPGEKERLVEITRRWVMRDLRNGSAASAANRRIRELADLVFERFDKGHIEGWSDSTWEAFCLHLLWLICREGAMQADEPKHNQGKPLRHRDILLDATGDDADQFVNDMLITFCAAFIDQGFAHWTLPRETGFFLCFTAMYRQAFGPPVRWLKGLKRELARIENEQVEPLGSIQESLNHLGVSESEQSEFIAQTLLALRGYAGMIWQIETRGDRVASPASAGSLIEFLAVRLILERFALTHIAGKSLGYRGPLSELRDELRRRDPPTHPPRINQRAFLVFQLAQLLSWNPETLSRLSQGEWTSLIEEIEAFSDLERRRIYHLAFERRYRMETLDAVSAHAARHCGTSNDEPSGQAPSFQVICCIDEREESFRRHLEEIAPDCETLGAAGFFAVAMNYRGAADAHYTPLCPVIIKPEHYVAEEVAYTFEQAAHRRREHRRTIGTVTHQVHMGSRTFAGGWLAAVLGSLASIPLVMRTLFPRVTARLRGIMGTFVRTPAVTQLRLERTEDPPGPDKGHEGYRLEEMATIVERLLRDMGVTKSFARLVIVCGHGSSSLNNPHEAAHDCGACGGGRGGPNARAFAQMAGNPAVREIVARNGLEIPGDTVFVGAYHNTCDDSIAYYDLDRLPLTHKDDFARVTAALDEARKRSAHERCRRFESADLNLNFEAALRHVEGRAEDLSQVRPEYGHATNALCFVGRRQWSRGLFLDRRAFLQSYDPAQDDDQCTILTRILQAVIPVCAGINLEYYFSFVDPTGYGCGTKLPHNITSLLGVMNGAGSDLRTGLPWQMVEIHEPVRLLFVIETAPETMLRIMQHNEGIDRLVRGNWVQLATLDPATAEIQVFRNGSFERYVPQSDKLPEVERSIDWYRGWRNHLGFARIVEQHETKQASGKPIAP